MLKEQPWTTVGGSWKEQLDPCADQPIIREHYSMDINVSML